LRGKSIGKTEINGEVWLLDEPLDVQMLKEGKEACIELSEMESDPEWLAGKDLKCCH
jgi:hypothetical protein